MVYHCGNDELTEFPLISFLLEGDGHKILIDTGGSEPDGEKWMPYVRADNQTLDAQLREHSVAPETIDSVFFTHLHWDHVGNNTCVPHAKFYVQREEYCFIQETDRPGYERELVLASEYQLLDGDHENVLPGISVLFTPGHSVGSQTIVVETDDGPVALAGDLIPTWENIELGLPNGGNYDLDIIRASMERVCKLGIKILPGHEKKLFAP